MPYSPLGRGFLTGKFQIGRAYAEGDIRGTIPRFERDALEANLALVDLLKKFGDRRGATPAQMALAWVLAQRPWIVPIPGTTRLHRLEENIGAMAIRLSPQELSEMEAACARIEVVGARYPDSLEQLTGL